MYETADATIKSPGALDELDRELERFDKPLAMLAERVAPIVNQYAGMEKVQSEPRPEPSTQLRGRVERLRDLITRLDQIQGEIDL